MVFFLISGICNTVKKILKSWCGFFATLQLIQHLSSNCPRETKEFGLLKIDTLIEELQGSACLTENKASVLPELTLLF